MKRFFIMPLLAGLLGCNGGNSSKSSLIDTGRYQILEHDEHDDKRLFSERIILTRAMNPDTVQELLKERLWSINYHTPEAQHVLIYVYKDAKTFAHDGANWVGMLEKQGADSAEVSLKVVTNPADPITIFKHTKI